MNRFNSLIKLSVILLWLVATFFAARWIENWRLSKSYADLLPPSAQQVLAEQENLQIDVFAIPGSAAARLVKNFLQPLIVWLDGVEINYMDMNDNIELVKQYGIQKQGEMVIHKEQQKFQLSTLSYEAFFNGLKRLSQPDNKWIVFVENLSSHSFNEHTGSVHNNGYSDWLKQLLAANYQVVILPWKPSIRLPKQTQLIVLAAPSVTLTEAQLQWLEGQAYLGRSILWLTDPRYASVQPALSLMFDVMRADAFHQGQLIIKDYPKHPVNQSFDRPIDLSEVMPFETTNQPLWLNDQDQILAATQQLENPENPDLSSRLMVVGDSDFLSNQYLDSGGNLEISYRMLDWLLEHDERVDLPSIGVSDSQVHFSANEILWFAGIMLVLIPLVLLLMAGYFWRKTK